jgi:hypothetical protein
VFLVSLESSRRGGVHGLGSMMFGLVVQKFLNIEWFLHWKLYWIVAKFFLEELECAFGVVGKILMRRIKWNLFGKIGFRMWEILISNWFLPLKIQIISKNQVLEGKITWGHGNTWANGTGHTSDFKHKRTACSGFVCSNMFLLNLFLGLFLKPFQWISMLPRWAQDNKSPIFFENSLNILQWVVGLASKYYVKNITNISYGGYFQENFKITCVPRKNNYTCHFVMVHMFTHNSRNASFDQCYL